MSLETKDYIKHVVKVCFNTSELLDKQADYKKGLLRIFDKQSSLVLYPNNDVTCFKYKNETYFNPNYPKLADNKVTVNLRHLHPSLHKEMEELIKSTAELSVNQKRFEAYCNRAAKYLIQEAYSLIDGLNPTEWPLIAFGFIFQCLPSSLYSKHIKNLQETFDHQIQLNSLLDKSFLDDLMSKLKPFSDKFKEKEKTCVDQIDTFMFTIDVLEF